MVDVIAVVSIAFSGISNLIMTIQNSKCDKIDLRNCVCHRDPNFNKKTPN